MRRQLLIAALFIATYSFGQKVDLDKFRLTCQFRTLPNVMLDTSYHTYNVRVEGTRLMQSYLNDLTPEKSVILEGWRRLDRNGHLVIDIKLEDLLPEGFSVQEREEILRDRAGKETGRRKYYWQEVTYTFSAMADITDYKGVAIRNVVLADRNYKQTYKSPEFAVRQMAEGYFLLNSLTITGQLYKNCVNRALSTLSRQLTSDYGYGVTTVTDYMWILDSRKHPEYQAHRQAFQLINDVLFSVTADRPLDGIREKLAPAIDYFESIKRKYTSTSKWDRKLRYASYYNLAVLYYYLDDPQAMQREANGLVLNDFDAKDGKAFEQTAIYLKNLFTQSKINSRHFAIDTASFRGPGETAGVAAK